MRTVSFGLGGGSPAFLPLLFPGTGKVLDYTYESGRCFRTPEQLAAYISHGEAQGGSAASSAALPELTPAEFEGGSADRGGLHQKTWGSGALAWLPKLISALPVDTRRGYGVSLLSSLSL